MSAKEFKEELTNDIIGYVEDSNDPKRMGRVRVRIERLHGRSGDKKSIPTEDLPWCDVSFRDNSFDYPAVGKVVSVIFEDGDYYKPIVNRVIHYDVNLQNKLKSLNDASYKDFFAKHFDDAHQYYHDKDEGITFDYVKSNINMRPNGDIKLNLRDNQSKLYLGTEDATQQAMLGNHWIDFFDELIQNLMGAKGGPYLGNMGSPVIPNPSMIEICNKYLAIKETFLSDHVFITDDNKIKPQTRGFDTNQRGDSFNDEKFNKSTNTKNSKGYETKPRKESGGNPNNSNIPPTNFSDNLNSSKLPKDATPEEIARTQKPFQDEYKNGEIPLANMTISKHLMNNFTAEEDERKYLLDEASKSLDAWLDLYEKEKKSDWNIVIPTKGYQNLKRQQNTREQYPLKAPIAGQDPFGNANQVELYFGVDKNNKDLTTSLKEYLTRGSIDTNKERSVEIEILDWLVNKGKTFKWRLAGRTATGDQQWWHWIYDSSL